MAFHHDIYFLKDVVIEKEYSQKECIDNKWFDPIECKWIREFIPNPNDNFFFWPELNIWLKKDEFLNYDHHFLKIDSSYGKVYEFMLKK